MFNAIVRLVPRIGLALLVGAVLHTGAFAQVPPRDTTRARRDSILADSIRRARADTARRGPDSVRVAIPTPADSARADSARARLVEDSIRAARLARKAADSIKAPLARAEVPPLTDIGQRYRWSRDELFSSGALSLGEMLGRIPGVTDYASAWVATPHTNTYLGDFRRVRLFMDGVELDPLDPRVGPMHDFASIQMWTLEELVVERAAEELRVYMRTWRVQKTTAYTRVDVATGDLATNSYRGFFGRRYSNGMALQIGAQQYSTQDPRAGGDGDLLGLLGRVGWAKKQWSVDGLYTRTRRSRTEQLREENFAGANLPGLEATRWDGYLRLGYGDPESSLWFQAIAASSGFAETNTKTPVTTPPPDPEAPFVGDTVDTTASRAQYLVTGGTKLLGASVSAAGRLRVYNSQWFLTPSARISYEKGMVSLTAYAEQQESDSTFRGDVSARITPVSFLSFAGSLGRSSPINGNERPGSLGYRAEAGVRLGKLWATGGIMLLDTTFIPAPIVYDTLYQSVAASLTRASFLTLRGSFWKALGVNIVAHKWPAGHPYMPQYQVKSELYASTSWLSKFPTGNFHILASVGHEYRTAVAFPIAEGGAQISSQYRVISSLIELRLYDAVLSWQYRNMLGEIYSVVPGYTAPRAINYYGVRWDFFN